MSDRHTTVPITICFSQEQAAELRELAREEDRPVSSLVRRLVTAGIEATYESEEAA
jgi:hypothetical protein